MTTASESVFKKLPGVLSFQRGLVISDAELFNEIEGEYEAYPIHVVRHGIRGTQNINKEGSGDTATSGNTRQREVSNIQQTDSAKLDSRADAMVVQFSLRFLDLEGALFACAPGKTDTDEEVLALRESITRFTERAKKAEGIDEVACRIARNIGNARWLWRNRVMASNIAVTVYAGRGSSQKEIARFDALTIPLKEFGGYSEAEQAVAKVIADGLRGRGDAALNVVARVEFGVRGAVEVFPSQNYVENKPDGFARSLYRLGQPEKPQDGPRIMGRAAIRDQKISNALRTIDTWYPGFSEHGRPIPVEPNGASLEAQRFFRNQRGVSAFDLVRRLNQIDPVTDEGMFLTACLIRGGVYSEKAQA